tara:strand:- start:4527 stop:5129 length:603 start_codon:yes stop_codon:yes gene_type:complete
MNLSDALDPEYGKNPMEQLQNVLFETKDKLDEKTYRILCELMLKVDKIIEHPQEELHCYTFKLVTPIISATDIIKRQLDYISDNYNSDFELEHEEDDEDNIEFVETPTYCKLYLKEKMEAIMSHDDRKYMKKIVRDAMKNPNSCRNYESSLSVAFAIHSKKIHYILKNHIDVEWTKQGKTIIVPIIIKPWLSGLVSLSEL